MTSKEWVKNELSLSWECLTTHDRFMLNKILKDINRLEELEKENQELKEENKELKKTYDNLYNDIINVIQEIKNLTMEADTNAIDKNSEEVFKAIKNLGWNEAIDIISTKLAVRMSIHILNKINIEEEK